MINAPTIKAITASDGMPSVSMGTNEIWAPALFADSGLGDAFDRALAEARRFLGKLLLQGIGRERRQSRAAAWQEPENRSCYGATHDGRKRLLELLPGDPERA